VGVDQPLALRRVLARARQRLLGRRVGGSGLPAASRRVAAQGLVPLKERLNKGLAMEKWSRNFISQRQGRRLGAGFGRIRLPVRRTGAVRALYAPWQRSR